MMKKYIFLISFFFTTLYSKTSNSVDCIILEDENSIICKYIHTRLPQEHKVIVQWIDPLNNISRKREMTIPAYHGSIYDYRYIQGRIKGVWRFEVIDNNKKYSTTFELK